MDFRARDEWIVGVLADPRLTHAAKVIAARIGLHYNIETGQCNPGYTRLTAGTHVKRRAVIAAVAALRGAGWLGPERSRGGPSNNFVLTAPAATVHAGAPSEDETVHVDAPFNGGETVRADAPLDALHSGNSAPPCTSTVHVDAPKRCATAHPNNEYNNEENNEGEIALSPDLFGGHVDAKSGGSSDTAATLPKGRKHKSGSRTAGALPARSKRAVPLPDGWLPDFEAASAKFGIQAEREFEKFSDHHLAKGSKFVDWDAAFRQWCRRTKEFRQRDSANGTVIDQCGNPVARAAPRRSRSFMDLAMMEINNAADE